MQNANLHDLARPTPSQIMQISVLHFVRISVLPLGVLTEPIPTAHRPRLWVLWVGCRQQCVPDMMAYMMTPARELAV